MSKVSGGKLLRIALLSFAAALTSCASVPTHHAWEDRLYGDNIVLLGELHDNASHHRQRLEVLRRAFAGGWRPAILMEQIDRERQGDIERARRERPRDAQYVISLAASEDVRGGNWNWDFYRPFVELALEYGVPLIAANLSSVDIGKVVREGYSTVFDPGTMRLLRLDEAVPADLQAAQEHEIDDGHCNVLPARVLPAMVRGQFARDAVMASILKAHAVQGAVLLAGNGHVRRDIGVPRWLSSDLRARTLAVGYLEHGGLPTPEASFDAVIRTAAAERPDPCVEFKKRLKRP